MLVLAQIVISNKFKLWSTKLKRTAFSACFKDSYVIFQLNNPRINREFGNLAFAS